MKTELLLLIKKLSFTPLVNSILLYSILAIATILIAILSNYIARLIINIIVQRIISKTKTSWDDIFYENKFFHRISHIVPAIIIYGASPLFGKAEVVIEKLSMSYMVIAVVFLFDAFFRSIDAIYQRFEISKEKPIKGYLQVIKMFIYSVAAIIVIGFIINRSPWQLLTGIGAMTAVILLIFKDSILGFVAGIKFASNDMVHIGDWIEMPKYNADGDVIDITLTTIKIRNFDKTITTIPTNALIEDSFKNWRGMVETGARRIKRSIYIDLTSVKFCDNELINKMNKIELLKGYLKDKVQDVNLYNKNNSVEKSIPVNGRHLTNVGTFRAYITEYLKNHPLIHQDMTLIVRQLQPEEKGLPIEIYTFSNDTDWKNYEALQSDIFDHIFAVLPYFDLKIFQFPTGDSFIN